MSGNIRCFCYVGLTSGICLGRRSVQGTKRCQMFCTLCRNWKRVCLWEIIGELVESWGVLPSAANESGKKGLTSLRFFILCTNPGTTYIFVLFFVVFFCLFYYLPLLAILFTPSIILVFLFCLPWGYHSGLVSSLSSFSERGWTGHASSGGLYAKASVAGCLGIFASRFWERETISIGFAIIPLPPLLRKHHGDGVDGEGKGEYLIWHENLSMRGLVWFLGNHKWDGTLESLRFATAGCVVHGYWYNWGIWRCMVCEDPISAAWELARWEYTNVQTLFCSSMMWPSTWFC